MLHMKLCEAMKAQLRRLDAEGSPYKAEWRSVFETFLSELEGAPVVRMLERPQELFYNTTIFDGRKELLEGEFRLPAQRVVVEDSVSSILFVDDGSDVKGSDVFRRFLSIDEMNPTRASAADDPVPGWMVQLAASMIPAGMLAITWGVVSFVRLQLHAVPYGAIQVMGDMWLTNDEILRCNFVDRGHTPTDPGEIRTLQTLFKNLACAAREIAYANALDERGK